MALCAVYKVYDIVYAVKYTVCDMHFEWCFIRYLFYIVLYITCCVMYSGYAIYYPLYDTHCRQFVAFFILKTNMPISVTLHAQIVNFIACVLHFLRYPI